MTLAYDPSKKRTLLLNSKLPFGAGQLLPPPFLVSSGSIISDCARGRHVSGFHRDLFPSLNSDSHQSWLLRPRNTCEAECVLHFLSEDVTSVHIDRVICEDHGRAATANRCAGITIIRRSPVVSVGVLADCKRSHRKTAANYREQQMFSQRGY